MRWLLLGVVTSGLVLRPNPTIRSSALSAEPATAEVTAQQDSAEWLARQGIVGPGASEEQHAIAKAARRKKQALTTTTATTRWGDPKKIGALKSTGEWSQYTEASASRSAAEIVGKYERSRRLSHVLLASEAMARSVLGMVAVASCDFEDLARNVSLCLATQAEGGSIGWVDHFPADEALVTTDDVLPAAARVEVMARALKPGDVTLVESRRGFHVVKVDDVLVRTELTTRKRRWATVPSADDDDDSWAGKTYRLTTQGCQMNAADSERLEGSLEELGLVEAAEGDDRPDVVVVNTCSIRDRAEQKVYSHLGMHARRKRRGDDVMIVVAGCVAQQEGERLLRRCPEVDVVMGPQYANRLGDVLDAARRGEQVIATAATYNLEDTTTKPKRASTVCAWVNVAHGCNERCTYCVVPATRGVEQSRAPDAILNELRDLGQAGFSEATLLGQNVDAYGRDMTPRRTFADLLEAAVTATTQPPRDDDAPYAPPPPLKRIRFVTSHPRYMSDRVVDVVARHADVLMPVFHVPAQAGDDEMLKWMGRGYTAARYLAIVDRIRAALPDATITSDFIVGCPGETEAMFQRTLDLMRAVKFDSCMTAAYSPRPGTPMARWDGAADAFDRLGVDVARSSTVDDLEAAVDRQFRELAKTHHPDKNNSSSSSSSSSMGTTKAEAEAQWVAIVEAKKVATAKLAAIRRDPLGAFPPLSEIGPHQIDEETKERRLLAIKALADQHALERAERYRGRVEAVLVESRHTRRANQVVGRTRGNKLVFIINGTDDLLNTVVNVRITEVNTYSLEGVLVDAQEGPSATRVVL